MTEPIKVLYAEDNLQDADLLRARFLECAPEFDIEVVDTGRAFLERLRASVFDVLLLDNHLPDMDGLEVLRTLFHEGRHPPVVLVTGVGDEELVVKALRLNAANYVTKHGSYLEQLPDLLREVIEEHGRMQRLGLPSIVSPRRILYVEAQAMDIDLTLRHFAEAAPQFAFDVAESCAEALSLLETGTYDLALVDLRMPDQNGLDFVREARHRGLPMPPFILVTGRGDETAAISALNLGAADYVIKREGYLGPLPHSMERAIAFERVERVNRRLEAELAERRKAEEALRSSGRRYRDLFDACPDGIVIIGTDGLIQDANITQARMYGFDSAEDLHGTPATQLVAPSSRDLAAQVLARRLRGEVVPPVAYSLVRRDGTTFPGETYATILRDPDGAVSGYICVTRDTSERVRAEQELRASDQTLRDILANVQDAYIRVGRGGRVQMVSPSAVRMYGYGSMQEMIGLPVEALSETADYPGRLLAELEAHGNVRDLVGRGRRKDGTFFWFSLNARLLHEKQGRVAGAECFVRDITERKQAESQLEEAKHLVESVVENVPLMIFLKEAQDLRFVLFNRAGEELLGHDRKDLIGRNNLDLFPPEQAAFFMAKDREVLSAGVLVDIPEEPIQTAKKGIRLLHTRKVCIRGADGATKYLLGISEDITDRKQAEEELARYRVHLEALVAELDQRNRELQATSERLVLATRAAQIGVWDWDVERDELVWDDAMYALYGIRREDFGGAYSAWSQTIHPDERERAELELQAALRGEREYEQEFRVVWPDGSIHSIQTAAQTFRGPDGRPIRMVGINYDTTERRQAENSLRESEFALQESQRMARLGSFVLDLSSGIFLTTSVLDELYGIDKTYDHSIAGWASLLHPDDRVALLDYLQNDVIGRMQPFDREFRIVRPNDQALRWLHAVGRLQLDAEGRLVSVRGTCQDITERRLAERERESQAQRLLVSQKLESLGTLASGVAHEINNPLNVILNYADLIRDEAADLARVREYAGDIVREGERVATIVRNLLSFARTDDQKSRTAAMEDIVERTLSLMRNVLLKDRIKLTFEKTGDLPPIVCRPQQMQQVLMNLVTNARDALNERYPGADGNKTVRVLLSSFGREGAPWIRLSVEDHGHGISPEVANRMFDPFFTTKPRDSGTGLGLSISYGIVKEHGGEITFETEPGAGTTFHVDLPAGGDGSKGAGSR